MRLPFVAVAASVLGVGANSEPLDVSSARSLLPGSTEVSKSNEEERGLPNKIAGELSENILNDGSMLPLKRLQTFSEDEPRLKRIKAFLDEPLPDNIHQQLEVHEKMDKNQAKFIMDLYEIITNFKNSMDKESQTSLFKTLIDDFGKEKAAMVIAIAEEGWHIKFKTMRRMWIKGGIEPDVVFSTILRAGKKQFLKNTYVNLWNKYVTEFNARYPTKQKSWIDWLEYDDITLLELAGSLSQKVRRRPFTKDVRTKLHESWHVEKLTPDEVFTRLRLDKKENLDFESLYFVEWIDYVYELEGQSLHKTLSHILILLKYYEEDGLFAMLQEAVITSITKQIAFDFRSYMMKANPSSEKIDFLNHWLGLDTIPRYRFKIFNKRQ